MAGKHRISYEEGDLYEGEWSADGKRHGRGVLSLVGGARYAGEFVNGFFQGEGVLSYPDGSRYEGCFQVGKYHGYGVYRGPDGMKYEGQFADGSAKGLGLVTFPDGSNGRPSNEGRFEGEVCIERCKTTEAVKRARQAASNARSRDKLLA